MEEGQASPDPMPEEDRAKAAYMNSCTDYLKRQILIYTNWPQRRYHAMGYSEEKVFTDMNA